MILSRCYHKSSFINLPYFPAEKSIKRFRDIELNSGIEFFNEDGFINIFSETETSQDDLELFAELCNQINTDGHTCIKVIFIATM